MPQINFKRNDEDMAVLRYGAMGLYGHTIARRTGLSVGQVRTRLRQGGVQLKEYRNGGFLAEDVIQTFEENAWLEKELQKRIRAQMKKNEEARLARLNEVDHKVIRLPRKPLARKPSRKGAYA
jgi:hypothetical protein